MKRSILTSFIAVIIMYFTPLCLHYFGYISDDTEWYLSAYLWRMCVVVLSALIFNIIPKKETICRTISIIILIFVITDSQFDLIYYLTDYQSYIVLYLSMSLIFFITLTYNLLKPYKFKSDIITENSPNIFLCFWTPSKGLNLLPSLLGFPFGGMCLYSQGILYGFEWSKKTYQIREVSHRIIKDKFVVHDTNIAMNTILFNMLQNLYGIEAGRFRVRCISIIAPVLELMGSKYKVKSWIDKIPSIKAAEILGR